MKITWTEVLISISDFVFGLIPSIFQELAVGTLVNVRHQSGDSADCIETGGWPYNKFTVHNTANN